MKPVTLLFALLFGLQTFAEAQCYSYTRDGVHVVQKGETLYSISRRYGLSVDQLAQINGLNPSNPISICQELAVRPLNNSSSTSRPTTVYETTTVPTSTTKNVAIVKQDGRRHVVQRGESVANLARAYGYTEERFREMNDLSPTAMPYIGQVLISDHCHCPGDTPNNDAVVTRTVIGGKVLTYNDDQPTTNMITTETEAEKVARIKSGLGDLSSADELTSRGPTTTQPTTPSPAKGGLLASGEQAMLDEINLVRSNPKGYIPYVEAYIQDLKTNGSFGNSIAAAQELIEELKNTPPLSVLEPTECLYQAAKDHGMFLYAKGSMDHRGANDSWPWDRVMGACPSMTDGNENLVGGPEDIRTAVMLLLVDEGIANRGHRKTMLNPDWRYAAPYRIGQVGNMPNCWIQKFGK